MSNTAFSTASAYRISQPAEESKVILRLSSASDTGDSVGIYGTISGVPGLSTVTTAGQREVVTDDSFTALTQALAFFVPVGSVTGLSPGTAAIGDISAIANPADGATITVGLTGSGLTYRFKDTLAAAYDVKRGASATDSMLALKKAINADGVSGTDYYAGTAQNPVLSAAVSTTVITVTDRLGCARQLGWVFSESASNFALRLPMGGIDGATLFTTPAGVTTAANPLTFSSEDHATVTLPGYMRGTSSMVAVGGNRAMLRLWSDQDIDYKIESSTDQSHWVTTSEGTETLVASTLTYIHLAELHEFIRFVITTNSNTDDTVLDARVIF